MDEGPYTVDQDFAGHASYGIQLVKIGPLGTIQNTILEDLSILTTSLPNQHSVIVEGQRHPTLKDLWIWTLGGTHGLVVKSLDSIVDTIHCAGAASDCLILKSDYDTDRGGDASGTVVSNIDIHYLQKPGDTGGIQLEGRWDSLRHISLANIHETGLKYGIIGTDSVFHDLADATITNWSADDIHGPCLVLNGASHIDVAHFTCDLTEPRPMPAIVLLGTNISLTDGQITCTGPSCSVPTLDAIIDNGRHNRVDHISALNLGGYLIRTSPHTGGTLLNALVTQQMNNRSASIFRNTPRSWLQQVQTWSMALKADLRIVLEKTKNLLHLQ